MAGTSLYWYLLSLPPGPLCADLRATFLNNVMYKTDLGRCSDQHDCIRWHAPTQPSLYTKRGSLGNSEKLDTSTKIWISRKRKFGKGYANLVGGTGGKDAAYKEAYQGSHYSRDQLAEVLNPKDQQNIIYEKLEY